MNRLVFSAWAIALVACQSQTHLIDIPPDAAPPDAPPATCDPSSLHPDCASTGSGSDTSAHGTQATALAVTAENGESTPFDGVLDTTASQAWLTYTGDAGTFGSVDPQVAIQSWTKTMVCVYASCDWAASACPAGTEFATAPDGHHGCCSDTQPGFQVSGCSGSAQVWMSVQSEEPTECATCVPFDLAYNF